LELARELELPVIVHERDACADCLEIIRHYGDLRGVVHCFSGSWETAKAILDLGWFLSFTGVITFKNARRAPEVLQKMPKDRLMLETDAPYMAPVPVRGQRNDSTNLRYIARCAAEWTGLSEEELCALAMANSRRFFGL
jgi:TatD DNase family protein